MRREPQSSRLISSINYWKESQHYVLKWNLVTFIALEPAQNKTVECGKAVKQISDAKFYALWSKDKEFGSHFLSSIQGKIMKRTEKKL